MGILGSTKAPGAMGRPKQEQEAAGGAAERNKMAMGQHQRERAQANDYELTAADSEYAYGQRVLKEASIQAQDIKHHHGQGSHKHHRMPPSNDKPAGRGRDPKDTNQDGHHNNVLHWPDEPVTFLTADRRRTAVLPADSDRQAQPFGQGVGRQEKVRPYHLFMLGRGARQ